MVRGLAVVLAACWLWGCAEAPPAREKQPWDVQPAAGRPVAAPAPPATARAPAASPAAPRRPVRPAAALVAGCRARDGAACRGLQDLFDGDDTTPSNLTEVYDAFTAACDARTWEGCIGLALMHAEGLGVPTTLARAAAILRRACDGGSPRGCHLFAILLEDGLGVEADLRRAMDLQEAACRQGHQPACVAHGVQLLVDEGSEAMAAIALDAFKGACKAGEPQGCLAHALVLLYGIGVDEQRFAALELLTRSCLGGHGGACFYLGQAQPNGPYRPNAPLDGDAALVRGCELRDPESCLLAAFNLHQVEALVGLQGSERKPPRLGPEVGRARALYERACMLRLGAACLAAATMFEHGQPPPRDAKRALAYQQLACRYGAGEGGCDAGRRPSLRRLPQKR